jgi:hypothetical protein
MPTSDPGMIQRAKAAGSLLSLVMRHQARKRDRITEERVKIMRAHRESDYGDRGFTRVHIPRDWHPDLPVPVTGVHYYTFDFLNIIFDTGLRSARVPATLKILILKIYLLKFPSLPISYNTLGIHRVHRHEAS